MATCTLCGRLCRQHDVQKTAGLSCSRYSDPCLPCIKLKELQAEIAAARKQLLDLLSRLQPLQLAVNHAHDPLSKRLPPEITSRIFIIYVKSSPSFYSRFPYLYHIKSAESHKRLVPFTLGAVCKRWREIAWSTPHLWTDVYVRLDPDMLTSGRPKMLGDWLRRSGCLPLSIFIHQPIFRLSAEDQDPEEEEIIFAMLDAVNEHSSHWHTLGIHAPSAWISRLRGDGRGAPMLNDFGFFPTDYSRPIMEEQRPMYPFKLEGPAPSPETVNILDRRFRSICLDWSNVVDVTLAAVTVDECLELFRQGRQVGCCDLQVQAGNHGYPIPDCPILHEGIERMDISFWGNDGLAPQLFDKITFPSLAYLENSPGQTRHTSIDSLAAFFSRSACPVHHIKLSRLQVSVADVIRVLQTLPTVQFLHLFDITLTEEFFIFVKETNVVSGVGDCFLPCLETLCFSGPRQYSWTSVQRLIPLFSPSPEEDQVLRPWRELEIGVLEEGPDRTFIDEDTIAYFDNLGRRGIRANVEDLTSGGDYIKDSREYHNRRQQGEHTGAEHRQDDD